MFILKLAILPLLAFFLTYFFEATSTIITFSTITTFLIVMLYWSIDRLRQLEVPNYTLTFDKTLPASIINNSHVFDEEIRTNDEATEYRLVLKNHSFTSMSKCSVELKDILVDGKSIVPISNKTYFTWVSDKKDEREITIKPSDEAFIKFLAAPKDEKTKVWKVLHNSNNFFHNIRYTNDNKKCVFTFKLKVTQETGLALEKEVSVETFNKTIEIVA